MPQKKNDPKPSKRFPLEEAEDVQVATGQPIQEEVAPEEPESGNAPETGVESVEPPSMEWEIAQALFWCFQHNVEIVSHQTGRETVVQLTLKWYAANPKINDTGEIIVQRSHFLPAAKALQAYLNAINYGANTVI